MNANSRTAVFESDWKKFPNVVGKKEIFNNDYEQKKIIFADDRKI